MPPLFTPATLPPQVVPLPCGGDNVLLLMACLYAVAFFALPYLHHIQTIRIRNVNRALAARCDALERAATDSRYAAPPRLRPRP